MSSLSELGASLAAGDDGQRERRRVVRLRLVALRRVVFRLVAFFLVAFFFEQAQAPPSTFTALPGPSTTVRVSLRLPRPPELDELPFSSFA